MSEEHQYAKKVFPKKFDKVLNSKEKKDHSANDSKACLSDGMRVH